MDKNKIARLNCLFEKMVIEQASTLECSELKYLYNEYIDEGRKSVVIRPAAFSQTRHLVAV